MRIGWVGLGKLGLPCASVLKENGFTVFGYDPNLESAGTIPLKDDISALLEENCDIIFIAVPTPHDPIYDGSQPTSHLPAKDFNYDIVEQCFSDLSKDIGNTTVVLISTILPGTLRRLNQRSYIPKSQLIYNPYLIAMGTVASDMVNPEMVIIGSHDGTCNEHVAKLQSVYSNSLKSTARYEIGTWEEAEAIKVFYNTYLSMKLSLANMVQDVSEKLGNCDPDLITAALAKSTDRITSSKYMKPGMGDGGACHPRDNIALSKLAQDLDLGYDIFKTVIVSREQQAKNLAKKLIELHEEYKLPIYIHGKSYKPGVPYEHGSYSLLIGYYLTALGYNYKYIDPLTGDMPVINGPGVFLLAHSVSTTYNEGLDKLYVQFPENSVILDPWRKYIDDNTNIIYYGKT